MGSHAARRPDRRRFARSGLGSVQVRLILSLGVLALPTAIGTMAFWTDTATVEGGVIQSGTLDLTVGGSVGDSAHLPGQGGSFEYSQLTIGNLVPNESIARPLVVRNSGSVSFTYNATIATETNDLVSGADGLTVQVYTSGTPTNTGTEAAANRSGTCPGGTLISTQQVSMSTGTVKIHGTDPTLASGATQSYCARISLPSTAPNSLQGKATSLIIAVSAKQLGAP